MDYKAQYYINYFVIYTIGRSNTLLVTKKYVLTLFSIRPFHGEFSTQREKKITNHFS